MAAELHGNNDLSGLVVIDQMPLMNEALDACQRAQRVILQMREELQIYEGRDLPAFLRWYHSTFGRALSEIRELEDLIREKDQRLQLVRKRHWEKFFGPNPGIHFENSIFGDDDGYDSDDPESEVGAGDEQRSSGASTRSSRSGRSRFGFSEVDEEDISEEGLGSYYGQEEDELNSHYEEDDESVWQFEERLKRGSGWTSWSYRSRGWAGDQEEGARKSQSRPGAEKGRSSAPSEESAASKERSLKSRLKERYRILVRKLHPDMNSDLSQEEKNLWHQVQAAYQKLDLEQLDLLIALSDAFSGKVSGSTGLHQLRAASREIARLIEPLQRKLEEAKKDHAWKFTELRDRSRLQQIVEKELRHNFRKLKQQESQIDTLLERFLRPKPPSRKERATEEHEEHQPF